MKLGNKIQFGVNAVVAGQKKSVVNAMPQLIVNSTQGKFSITSPVSKALGVAVGENVMFLNNIQGVENAIQARLDDVVNYANENGIDIETREGQDALLNAFTQWYRESEQMPAFRSWENPYASFVDPIYSLAENPVQNAFLLYNLGNMGTVFNGLDRVRDVTSTSGVLLLGGLKSALNSDKTPSNYRMEDQIQLKFEQNKKTAGAMNYYDLNTNSTQSQLKSSLTYDESMAFNDLMNSNNLGAVTDVASERFQNIIALEQTKMNNYISNNDTFIERLGTYKTTQISDNYVSNDYFYNLAVAKQSIGYSLESLEKEKISNYQMNSSLSPSVSYDTLRNRYFGGKINSKVTSTIYTGTNSNKKY